MTIGVFANGERRLLSGGAYRSFDEIVATVEPLYAEAGHDPAYARLLAENCARALLGLPDPPKAILRDIL